MGEVDNENLELLDARYHKEEDVINQKGWNSNAHQGEEQREECIKPSSITH